ncbi:MAG: hypothetical protein AAF399_23050, partial [Bacteroidota bacterium]
MYKPMFLRAFCLLGSLWVSLSLAQSEFPPNFAQNGGTLENFCAPLSLGPAATALNTRFGDSIMSLPSISFPNVEGNTTCEPTYGFEVKLADADFYEQLNSERSAWNYDSDIAVFRGPNDTSLTFFDAQGDKIGSVAFGGKDFYTSPPSDWKNKLTTVRWHPTEDAIFYPKEGQLVKQSVSVSPSLSLGAQQVVAWFKGYTIGGANGNYRIAGGDGNDVNAGRFLVSLV